MRAMLLILIGWLASVATGVAATFNEPIGRFAMTLEEGWQLKERPQADVYIFKTDKGALYQLIYYPAVDSANIAFELTKNSLREALSNATLTPVNPAKTLTTAAGLARLALYSAPLDASGTQVTLYGHVGAAVVEGHAVGMMTVLNRAWLDEYQNGIRSMFSSLAPGHRPSGAPWEYKAEKYTMTVPGSWQPVPGGLKKDAEAEAAHFAVDRFGGKVLAICYPPASGIGALWGYNLKSVSSTADEELKLVLPASERLAAENRKLETGEARLARYESVGVISGEQMVTEAAAISIKGPGCWMNVIGYSETGDMDRLEKEMIRAVESLQ